MNKGILLAAGLLAAATAVGADDYPLKELPAPDKTAIDQAIPAKAPAKPKKVRQVLIVHITRRAGQPIPGHPSVPYGNYALIEMGKRTGAYHAVVNNDESVFRRENLKAYDAIIFNNTVGVLFDAPVLRQSLLDFVKSGKGFVGFHGGSAATFVQYPAYDQFPEFGAMVGGYEDGGHPWTPADTTFVKIDDTGSPLTAMFPGPFQIHDETFQLREPALRDRLHVLLSIDTPKMEMGGRHRILKQRQQDMDFPISWVKTYGKGRVFASTMGHAPEVFQNAAVLQHFLAGIQFALGDLKADDTPSLNSRNSSK